MSLVGSSVLDPQIVLRQIEILAPNQAYAVTFVVTSGLPDIPFTLDEIVALVKSIQGEDRANPSG